MYSTVLHAYIQKETNKWSQNGRLEITADIMHYHNLRYIASRLVSIVVCTAVFDSLLYKQYTRCAKRSRDLLMTFCDIFCVADSDSVY